MTHFEHKTVSEALPAILRSLLSKGDEVGSRNGRVKELLNQQIVITKPWRREVVSVNRKANVFAQIAETMWVLAGRNDIEWLSAYLPRAVDYSDNGTHWRAGYGPRIRDFNGVDQLVRVVETLKADPLSRQAVIQIWDVLDGELHPWKDRACNTQLQFLSRSGKLHMTVTVRSNDAMWGWSGINAFEWSTIQEIVASLLGIGVGPLTFNVGSLHLYEPHWEKARTVFEDGVQFQTIRFNPGGLVTTMAEVDRLVDRWFIWEGMCRTGEATWEMWDQFQEPLFKAWAAAIAYYWSQDIHWIETEEVRGTALAVAIARTPASVLPEPVVPSEKAQGKPVGAGATGPLLDALDAFYDFVCDLHAQKHASYGNSWKKRGEKMSILANIARKVDRLGVGDAFDSSVDTVIDLMVYLIKYELWLRGEDDGPSNVSATLWHVLLETHDRSPQTNWENSIPADFDYYCDNIDGILDHHKIRFIHELIERTVPIAKDLWQREQGDDYRADLNQ